ncbi:MAG: hypothetical protein MJZ15_06400 [Bacteroidales bacterium]|nr:hypothetical protein [Bacteroidales bacterium]
MKSTCFASLAFIMAACSAPQKEVAFQSTVANSDGTVTFNYKNDNAKSVQVDVQFAGRHDMTRDSLTGVWTATLGPAEPDMYPYNFVVDGVSIMDPECDEWFPNEGFKNSLLDIKGGTPLIHSIQNVPHGDVNYETYWSEAAGCYNHALVYTPATYYDDANKDKTYPVFYLISGTTDTEEVYYKVGRMNYIIDNLIAQGEAKEMIIVLPYGNPMKIMPGTPDFRTMGDIFSKDLIGDLMPYVESHYRTANDRESRAIGGFSRGGNQALSNGLMNLDKFSYLCSYSSFTTTMLPGVYDNAQETNEKINLFWLGIGKDDFLYKTSHDYLEFLDQKGINHVMEFTEGKFGHTWMNAKYFLSHTMPMLFNKEKSAEIMKNGIEEMPELKGDEQPFTPGVMARLFPKPIISPEFGEDGNVTFRIKAENAQIVKVEIESIKEALAMQRDSDGVWSTTTKMTPGIYCYNFDVDGLKVCDASNMYLAPEKGFKRSIAFIPGYSNNENDVRTDYTPVAYKTLDNAQKIAVCTPSGECTKTIKLVASKNDTFESWHKIGQVNIIMDQMVANGEVKPATLYMTDNNNGIKADITINADDYATWEERREALRQALKK